MLVAVDSIFGQRDELRDHWDFAVFLDVPFEVSCPAWRSGRHHSDPAHPDQARYIEGQRIYFAACHPRSRADVVVDNSDLTCPRIL